MSSVRGVDTRIECFVRSALHSKGLRFRKNVRELPGRPDVVLPRYHTVIFVNGCFWHGHKKCKASKLPDTRRAFWQAKIEENVARDQRNNRLLRRQGWRVLTLWECSLKNKRDSEKSAVIQTLVESLHCAI